MARFRRQQFNPAVSSSPGNSPGILTAGIFSLGTGAAFMEELGGTTAGTQYDQTVIPAGGSVALGDATLNISLLNGFLPTVGQQFTIIKNQSGSSVVGTFSQGSMLSVNGFIFGINYAGGTGHDVVLTVLAETTTVLSAVTTARRRTGFLTVWPIRHLDSHGDSRRARSGTPGGTVIFEDGSTVLGTVPLSQGSASLTTSTLAVGMHTITADFNGNDGWQNSVESLTQTVNRAPTTTAIVSSPSTPVSGQSINFHGHRQPDRAGPGHADGHGCFLRGRSSDWGLCD